MVIATAAAAFVVTFSIIASRALLNKHSYQNKVIGAKQKAVTQLQSNIKATDSLATSYKVFVGTASNVLGGNPKGTGDKDGDNGKIILDALPSQYDFPALASSLEKIIYDNNYKITSISGTDDELTQQGNQASPVPKPVPMPFQLSVTTNLAGSKNLLGIMERSIRPINVKTLTLSGSNSQLDVAITAETYYQPGKSLSIDTKVVK
jgi:hypothetical protein